jgi:uncharacterized membrane protein YdjX (TVP38/TMEM64 family)
LVTIIAEVAGTLGMIPYYLWCRRLFGTDWTDRFRSRPLIHRLINQLRQNNDRLLLALNIIPVPDASISLVAGSTHYPFWRFIAISQIGKLLHILPLTLGAVLFRTRVVTFRGWLDEHMLIIWLLATLSLGWWIISNWWALQKDGSADKQLPN